MKTPSHPRRRGAILQGCIGAATLIASAISSPGSLLVEQWRNAGNNGLAGVDAAIASRAPDITATYDVIDFTDDPSGFAGDIPGSTPWPLAAAAGATGTGNPLNDNFAARISGSISISVAGTYRFRTYADDGVRLKVGNTIVISDNSYHPETALIGSINLSPGVYPIELVFFEGGGEASLEFTVAQGNGPFGHVGAIGGIPTAPAPLVANAGPDAIVNEGQLVTLNGAGSTVPAGTTYAWTQVSGPAVILANAGTATPSFTAPLVPAAGAALVFQLRVTNGTLTPATDTVTINVANVNTPPTANAGVAQTIAENSAVTLNGGGFDADADKLTLSWTQLAGPTVVLSNADTANPTFTAPAVTAAQATVDLTFRLTVNDGQVSSGPSDVTIHVVNTNAAPVAVAGKDQSVNEHELVTLNGSLSSDPDQDQLSYSWRQIGGSPSVTLTGANTAKPSFSAPEVTAGGATLTFELTVSDGELTSASTVNVRVNNVNHVPLADAGLDLTVPENTKVELNGSQSADTDGDTLTYSWVQTGGSIPVVLSGANTAKPTFMAPDVSSTGAALTFALTVGDGYGGTATDEVAVNVTYVNRPPTIDAGTDFAVNEGDHVVLSASAADPDGNPLSYTWSSNDPTVAIADSGTATPSFIAPAVTRAGGAVALHVTVQDGFGGVAEDDVTVFVANVNRPPSAQAPANLSVPEGTLVNLIGQGADPDAEEQNQLSYAWQQVAPVVGPAAQGSTFAFVAPDVTSSGDPNAQMTLTFRLTATDPNGASSTDDVDVVITNVPHAPTAVAGGNLTVNEAASVTLNGLASSDPDGDKLTYSWVQTAGPAVTLNDAHSATPYFTAPFVNTAGATLKFQLTVDDGFSGSSTDCATVTVANINDPPIVTTAAPSVGTLWPPDHAMVPISITGVTDANRNATVVITGITQDEPTNGQGDGDTPVDAIISADGSSVLLRSERTGKGDGRVYRVSFTASDFEGSSSGVVKVVVPKSKKTDAAIETAASFDSTK